MFCLDFDMYFCLFQPVFCFIQLQTVYLVLIMLLSIIKNQILCWMQNLHPYKSFHQSFSLHQKGDLHISHLFQIFYCVHNIAIKQYHISMCIRFLLQMFLYNGWTFFLFLLIAFISMRSFTVLSSELNRRVWILLITLFIRCVSNNFTLEIQF